MPYAVLEEKIRTLPESCIEEILRFVDFMAYKVQMENTAPKPKRQLGIMRGKIKIAPDFDEPLECFKEYM